ncbi:MAG: hypothetical protein KC933_40830, partial [Myxococcales bacterium]|nr:hypothetical protein [Myxococcales bacterium]
LEEDEIPLDLGLDEEPTPAPPPPWRSSNPSTTPVPRTPIPHHLPMAASLSPAVTPVDEEQEALRRLWPVFEANQDVARALKAVFELCVARGIITREEYLERLASAPD